MPTSGKPNQDLSPDLKQIYDRVMNTPAKGVTATPPPAAAVTSPPTPVTSPAPDPLSTPGSNPIPPKPIAPSPTQSATPPVETAPFLTSSPPRPLQGSVGVKSFAMGKEAKPTENPIIANAEKKGMSKILVIVLLGVFFAAWIFFWVVFFFKPFN